ncbi:MAG: PmoA family protein [Christensenellales bacterium]|jgi:hypothetical protein
MIKKMAVEIIVKLNEPVMIGKTLEKSIPLSDLLPEETAGVIDEHSFWMEEVTDENKEVLVQFSSDIQQRIPRDEPPSSPRKPAPQNGTIPAAHPSALRYSCLDQGRNLARCSGTFTWLIGPSGDLLRKFLLHFDLVQEGEFFQLSPAPHNFVVIYPDGRIPQRAQYQRAQILPHITPDFKIGAYLGDELICGYNYSKDLDKPYFYPVRGPSGSYITTVGKPHDPTDSHQHHKSLWIAHQRINGVNFWEEWPDCGKITHQGFDELVSGPLFARIVERNRWERAGRVHAYEKRSFTLYKTPGSFRYIDIQIEMEPETEGRFAGDLVIGSTIWGFLAIRLKESMTPLDAGGEIRNSNGQINEHQVIWESAKWCDISGPLKDGLWNGAAIFDNPKNFSFPCGWQCRNDGFICSSFSNNGDYVVKMGEKLVVRHRVFLHEGNALGGHVEQAFGDYVSGYDIDFGLMPE